MAFVEVESLDNIHLRMLPTTREVRGLRRRNLKARSFGERAV